MEKKYISKIKAAVEILRTSKRSMKVEEIVDKSLEKKLIKVKGLTPVTTLNADIINEIKRRKRNGKNIRFKRVGPLTYKLISEK